MWGILAMGLADLWGIEDLHCQKVESAKWLKHKLRATKGANNLNKPMVDLGFLSWLEFVMQAFGDSLNSLVLRPSWLYPSSVKNKNKTKNVGDSNYSDLLSEIIFF